MDIGFDPESRLSMSTPTSGTCEPRQLGQEVTRVGQIRSSVDNRLSTFTTLFEKRQMSECGS